MELLGGEQGKALSEVKALLRSKDREGTSTGAVFFPRPVVEDEVEKAVVLDHRDGTGDRLRFVNAVGTEERLFLGRKVVPRLVELDIEAARKAGVAGAAVLLDLEEESVAVAIDEPTQDPLRVAA